PGQRGYAGAARGVRARARDQSAPRARRRHLSRPRDRGRPRRADRARDGRQARPRRAARAVLQPHRGDALPGGRRARPRTRGRGPRQVGGSAEHTDHLMRRATLWNDFWTRVPRGARRAIEALGRRVARGWHVDPALAVEYLFALVPAFERKGDRVMFAINILP